MSKEKYYITTAIAYTSGKPHIGNNYEIVLADSIARYKRAEGYDVYFQTGTDEHGQKIELKANEAGVTPKEFVDKVAGQIKDMCDLLNISYDHFIRTTDDYHEKQVQKIFKKLYDQGDIYKGSYEGLYCTPCESFWTESQLVDGKCPDCGREVKPAKEEAYFFKMSKYADRLIEHINTHPEFIQPVSRKNEMMNNFLLPGLQDLCVSRTSFKWGIPVDFDPKHVIYVWIDALSNYITGLGFDLDGNSDPMFEKYWPADLHLIGKDILQRLRDIVQLHFVGDLQRLAFHHVPRQRQLESTIILKPQFFAKTGHSGFRGGAAMCQFGRCHCRHTGRIFQHTIRDPLFRIEKVHPGAKQRDHTARRFAHNHPPVLSGPMPAFCSELV